MYKRKTFQYVSFSHTDIAEAIKGADSYETILPIVDELVARISKRIETKHKLFKSLVVNYLQIANKFDSLRYENSKALPADWEAHLDQQKSDIEKVRKAASSFGLPNPKDAKPQTQPQTQDTAKNVAPDPKPEPNPAPSQKEKKAPASKKQLPEVNGNIADNLPESTDPFDGIYRIMKDNNITAESLVAFLMTKQQ